MACMHRLLYFFLSVREVARCLTFRERGTETWQPNTCAVRRLSVPSIPDELLHCCPQPPVYTDFVLFFFFFFSDSVHSVFWQPVSLACHLLCCGFVRTAVVAGTLGGYALLFPVHEEHWHDPRPVALVEGI
uniref:Putative secreted protein n=1 Tax=Amblyomma parvum TaxID=251391 RepID=A0A023FZ89_AMBPA